MKNTKLAVILSIIASMLCFISFILKLVKSDKTDYAILLAGIFILGFGISTYFNKKK